MDLLAEFDGAVDFLSQQSAWLMTGDNRWVRRRVDGFEFAAVDRIRRKISIDFVLPHLGRQSGVSTGGFVLLPSVSADADCVPIPILTAMKGPLRGLDVFDEEGRSLPVLSREQNSLLVSFALAQNLIDELQSNGTVTASSGLDLIFAACREVPHRSPSGARQVCAFLNADRGSPVSAGDILDSIPRFRAALYSYIDAYTLHVAFTGHRGTRRIVKCSFDLVHEGTTPPGTRDPWVIARNLAVTDTSGSGSHHVEVVAPDGMAVSDVGRSIGVRELDATLFTDRLVEHSSRAHVVLNPSQTSADERLAVKLIPRSDLLHDTCVLVTGLSLLVIAAGAIVGSVMEPRLAIEAIAATFLTAISGTIAVVTRPGAHPLIDAAIEEPRFLLRLASVALAACAASIVIDTETDSILTETVWGVGAVLLAFAHWNARAARTEVRERST